MSLDEKMMKLNEQRFATIVILCNVLDTEEGVTDHIKSAICASLINMLERSMNDDDTGLVNLINNSIDNFCAVVEAKKGIENYRDTLTKTVDIAKKIVEELKTKLFKTSRPKSALIINEACEKGFFLLEKTSTDQRIKNIKPSESFVKEFNDYLDTLKNISY